MEQNLDESQYTLQSIKHYELIYGQDFVSPGGYEMALELIRKMNLAPQSRVLDAGCGLGGSAFTMAKHFDLLVDGIDLSENMLKLATEKLIEKKLENHISLKYGNCLDKQARNYDAVYSRDVFLHIHDKKRLLDSLYKSLKPSGLMLFTDYGCGPQPWKKSFADYVSHRGYCLHTTQEYEDLVARAGFVQVSAIDWTDRFISLLENEIEIIRHLEIESDIRNNLMSSWESKRARATGGDHRWVLVTASKSS